MSEAAQATEAPDVSANGSGPAPGPGLDVPLVSGGEKIMYLIMLAAAAGMLFLALDGLSGYRASGWVKDRAAGDPGDG